MPHVVVQMYPGRDEDTKMELAKAVAETISNKLNMRKEAISVSIQEVEKDNWKTEVYDKVTKDENKRLRESLDRIKNIK